EADTPKGGLREAALRAALYVGMARGRVDERGFAAIRNIRLANPAMAQLTLAEFKALLREQFFMLLLDAEAALAASRAMLPEDRDERRKAFAHVRQVRTAPGELTGEAAERLGRMAELFGIEDAAAVSALPRWRKAS